MNSELQLLLFDLGTKTDSGTWLLLFVLERKFQIYNPWQDGCNTNIEKSTSANDNWFWHRYYTLRVYSIYGFGVFWDARSWIQSLLDNDLKFISYFFVGDISNKVCKSSSCLMFIQNVSHVWCLLIFHSWSWAHCKNKVVDYLVVTTVACRKWYTV